MFHLYNKQTHKEKSVLLNTAVPEFCPCALLSQLAGIFFSPNGDRTGTAVLSSPEKSSKTINGVKKTINDKWSKDLLEHIFKYFLCETWTFVDGTVFFIK